MFTSASLVNGFTGIVFATWFVMSTISSLFYISQADKLMIR